MKNIVIYCSDYLGHVMECLGIANEISADGYKAVFAFITFPNKKAYDLISLNGIKVDVSNIYIKTAVKTESYSDLMTAIIDSVLDTLTRWKPEIVICDADDIVPLICRKAGVKVAVVKRTNIPAPIAFKKEFQEGILNNRLVSREEIRSLPKLIEGDIQLIPHSEFFYKISSQNPFYYCPNTFYGPEKNDFDEKNDILCVLSTAYDMFEYKNVLVETFKNTSYQVTILYPQAKEEKEFLDNVQVLKWANADALLYKAKLIISTGGHGIITKAIINRKPQIILEVNELFAIYYGKQLEEHKLGIFLKINEVSKDTIWKAFNELYNNENYKMHINYMSDTFNFLGHIKINMLLADLLRR